MSKGNYIITGKAWKFGDNISTDHICPGRYFHLRSNLNELAKHVLEDADQNFAKNFQKGGFVVAGRNFGLGSSREHAPRIIKIAGAGAILAKSYARIFFRNAINIGLPTLECPTDDIETGDLLWVNLSTGQVNNQTRSFQIKASPLPEVMLNILLDGGLVSHVQKHQGFKLHV